MISFHKQERDAHAWAQKESLQKGSGGEDMVTTIYEYKTMVGPGYGRSFAYAVVAESSEDKTYEPDDELVPLDARPVWRYTGGIPKDVRPQTVEVTRA